MLQRLTEKASDWILESVGIHDAILQRIAVPTTETPRSDEAIAIIDAARIQAAATLTAAIFERAGSTGPYDLLEDDPEGQKLLDARRQREERAEVEGLRGQDERTLP